MECVSIEVTGAKRKDIEEEKRKRKKRKSRRQRICEQRVIAGLTKGDYLSTELW